jgi:predicted phage baseplate assembly protein
MRCPPPPAGTEPDRLDCDVREARPAITLEARRKGGPAEAWWPVPTLLDSRDYAPHVVADIDGEGRAVLRFGDGEYGRRFAGIDEVAIRYRVGNGRAGNIGADALAHIVEPYLPPAGWPDIAGVRNPLPATGGIDPETIEEVRQYAPAAFRARQDRAVTARDYEEAALRIPGVAGAVAAFRWTGSWFTVFVGIDPASPDDVVADPRGVAALAPRFARAVHDALTRVRLAGYDLEIRSARYVPLEIDIELCASPGYFRGDVARAVATALDAGQARGGATGFFNPGNFTFGQPVYLSGLYAAIERVEGVESAQVTRFQRRRLGPRGELEQGVIPMGAWEIARLDNDRSNMENGTLRITAGGGL